VEFKDVVLRYRKDLDPALNVRLANEATPACEQLWFDVVVGFCLFRFGMLQGLSVVIEGGERVAVVGRTGTYTIPGAGVVCVCVCVCVCLCTRVWLSFAPGGWLCIGSCHDVCGSRGSCLSSLLWRSLFLLVVLWFCCCFGFVVAGAGKSTLATALFRLVELDHGSVVVDGVDLSNLGLEDVRGRGMAIIPQDPVLFSGTLLDNLCVLLCLCCCPTHHGCLSFSLSLFFRTTALVCVGGGGG